MHTKRNFICNDAFNYRDTKCAIGKQNEEGSECMVFNTGAALLDAIVLAVVSTEEEGTYGYKITQDVRKAIEVSESTLYPVLRRLQKENCLIVYDMECGGRNRRYYKITENGQTKLEEYRREWEEYSTNITKLFRGEEF